MRGQSVEPQKLADLIATAGLRYKENRLSFIFDCPKCHKVERLWMFKDTGRFICWYCAETNGFKGRAEYALAELMSRPVGVIQKELYGSRLTTADVFFDFTLQNKWDDNEEVEDVEVPDLGKLDRILWSPDYYPIDHRFSEKGAA